MGCLQEEADTKIMVHVKHCLLSGFRNIVIKTVDIDVLTLILAHLSMFDQPCEIEVDFNFGKDRKFDNINKISSQFTDQQSLGLLFFYVFTVWWKLWCQDTFVTETFIKLSWTPHQVDQMDLYQLETFVCAAYDPQHGFRTDGVNKLRYLLFTILDNNMRKLPPTREALRLHVFRSTYAAGWIWGVTLKRYLVRYTYF